MLTHIRILGADPFSIDPEPHWINIHWLFQVIVSGLHAVGGFELLSILKSLLAATTMFVFAASLRKRVPVAWLLLVGLLMLAVMVTRIRVRPEIFTFLFMMVTLHVVEKVRLGAPAAKLFWLVPLMVLWVNMHGLFILGLGIIWAAVLAAYLDKFLKSKKPLVSNLPTQQAVVASLAVTAACLLNPWLAEGAIQPMVLWTRISGQIAIYTYGPTELKPTWEVLQYHQPAIVLLSLTLIAMLVNFRRVPIAHVIWLLAFATIGAMARRNVGVMAVVCGYLLAAHGGEFFSRIATGRPKLRRCSRATLAIAMLLTAASIFAYVTEVHYQTLGLVNRFGVGLAKYVNPTGVADYLGELESDGDILCQDFGNAGLFIYRCGPTRRLSMDGRLEAHSLEQFEQHNKIVKALKTPAAAEKVEFPESVRFIVVRHDRSDTLSTLATSERFKLICIDHVAACFERLDWSNQDQMEPGRRDIIPAVRLDAFDRPLESDGLVECLKVTRKWYAQNPPSVNYNLGGMLLGLSKPKSLFRPARHNQIPHRMSVLAIRYLSAAHKGRIADPRKVTGRLAQAYDNWSLVTDFTPPPPTVPIDINFARARYLFATLDKTQLPDADIRRFATANVYTLAATGYQQQASAELEEIIANMSADERKSLPRKISILRENIAYDLQKIRNRIKSDNTYKLPMEKRIPDLISPPLQMINTAIAELRGQDEPAKWMHIMLGDLLLRKGLVDDALKSYAKAKPSPDIEMRKGLCMWVRGDLFKAAEKLKQVAIESPTPVARYYAALLTEQLGDYKQAAAIIGGQTHSKDELLESVIKRLRQRLLSYFDN